MKRRGSVSRGGFAPTIGASARDVSYQRRHTTPWYVDTNRTACRGLFSSYIALVFRVNRRRRSSRARSDAFVRVQVQMVFCYTIDRSMSTSRNDACDDFDEIARVRADVEKAIPRQSHDVVSVPASRRRVERDASSNASRGVRAARSYRERGLLFFVLDACGRVRRRAAKRARYPKVRCLFVISVAHARFFRSGGGRKRARAERARREARRKTRDRWPNARHHLVREKHRRDRLRSRHAPAAEATSRMGDVPVLLVYANPKAKPPPRHALASALWFRTSRLPTVISGRVGSKKRACP